MAPVINIAQLAGLRRPVTLRPIETTQAQADDLARIYMPVVRAWDEGCRTVILPEYERSLKQALMTDSADDVSQSVEAVENGAVRVALSLARGLFEGWAARISQWHLNRFVRNLTYATNVDASTILQGYQSQTVEDIVARNVSLIRDVSDLTRGRIADAVLRGLQARTPVRDVARELRRITGMSRDRSLRIASDQTVKLSAALDRERQIQVGITSFEWRHSGKLHYRPEHKARNGRIFAWNSDVARNDPPGYAPFCFPSRQPVAFHDDIFSFWKRFHRGYLTTFVTEAGETIQCTPNHPVLTTSGWKAAKSLQVGDYVVASRDCGVHIPNVNVEKAQPRIGNLFEACQSLFGSVTIDGAGSEFHGDATVNEEIEIVNIKGGLRNNIKTLADKDFVKFFLKESFGRALLARATEFFGPGNLPVPHSDMRSLDLFESALWGEFGPLDSTSLTPVAQLYSEFFEPAYECWSGDSDVTRNRVGRFAGHVPGDHGKLIEVLSVVCLARDMLGGREPPARAEVLGKSVSVNAESSCGVGKGHTFTNKSDCRIKNVVIEAWDGHVYNFETGSGWYSAGSIAVKNCGCKALGVVGTPEDG